MTRVPRGTIRSSRGTLTNGTNMRTTKAASITQLEVLGSNYWMPAKRPLVLRLPRHCPDPHCLVIRRAGQAGAVGAEADAVDLAGVSVEGSHFLAGLRVPQPHRP